MYPDYITIINSVTIDTSLFILDIEALLAMAKYKHDKDIQARPCQLYSVKYVIVFFMVICSCVNTSN